MKEEDEDEEGRGEVKNKDMKTKIGGGEVEGGGDRGQKNKEGVDQWKEEEVEEVERKRRKWKRQGKTR